MEKMNFQKAYAQSRGISGDVLATNGEDKEEKEKIEFEKKIIEDQRNEWLTNPNTQSLLIFLAKRELQCLDAARNNVGKSVELTNQFLYRSKETRKIINYVETGRDETTES